MSNLAKKIVIPLVIMIASTIFWFFVRPWIDNPYKLSLVSVWLKPLISLVVLAPLIVIALAIVKKGIWSLAVTASVWLPFLVIFGFNYYYLIGVIIMFALFSYGDHQIDSDLSSRLRIEGGYLMRSGLKYVISPLLIMVSFVYFLSPMVQGASSSKNSLPPTLHQVINATVDTFIGGQINQLPPREQTQAKNQIVSEVIKEITNLTQPYLRYLPPILAFGLFLVLGGLSFVFIWFSVLLGTFIFWVLRKVGFIEIKEREVKAQDIVEL